MPVNSTCGRCVSPLCERRRLSIPHAHVLNGSCQNSLSLWRFREFRPTTISRSAVFVPWLLPAKSVAAPVAPKGVRPVWGLPPSLAPGWPNSSIPSTNVWQPSLQNLLWVKSEQYRDLSTVDILLRTAYSDIQRPNFSIQEEYSATWRIALCSRMQFTCLVQHLPQLHLGLVT